MDQERHKRVTGLFSRAVELEPEERDAFLQREAGSDADLIEEVRSLLAHDVEEDPLGATAPLEDLTPGERIGPYRILEKLGEGGMGAVYLAEQDQPIRRKVALKIIKLGMDTRSVVARFEAERQALAMMSHPNIAKVLDAGATERGRPYFVMEHVPGIPITEYCDKHRLNTKERLELYIPVCLAIQHAHQKAIIHRDIKPSNVLVMLQDGKPVPKVIDFGVAKAINQQLTEKTIFTEQGRLIGTPVYMSPEQAEMTGLNVDTTTDVYSLGVMLYELLVGVPPFDPQYLRMAGLEAIYRIIREEEPQRPSTRLSTLGDGAALVALTRSTEPARLERQVRGELDWITMRAMEKDRSRRYASASELAADIERHLFGEPVAAGPPTAGYRIGKFVRRHRAGVWAGAAAVFALLAFAVAMMIQADRIARERDHARMEARRSRLEAQAMQSLLRKVDFSGPTGTESPEEYWARVREAIDLHRRSQEGDLTELALYLANQLSSLTYLYLTTEQVEYLTFRSELEPETFAIIHLAVSERDSSLLGTIDLLLSIYEPEWFLDAIIRDEGDPRRPEDAERLYRDALALRREIRPPDAPDLIQNLMDLSGHLRFQAKGALASDQPEKAESYARESMGLLTEASEEGGAWIWWQMREAKALLGEALTRMGQYSEAEPLLLASLESHRRADLLRVIDLYEAWGKPEEAGRYRADQIVESIQTIGTIADQDGGPSIWFGGRSTWLFTSPYGAWGRRANTWAWTDARHAQEGLEFTDPGGMTGGKKLLPFTAEEASFNEARAKNDEKGWALLPASIVLDKDRNRALIVYTKGLSDEGYKSRGVSVAVWAHPDSEVVRPIVRPGTGFPTLLFQGDGPGQCAGAMVKEGFLYLYSSRPEKADFGAATTVARAPLGSALDRAAWRFYAAGADGAEVGAWVENWEEASEIMSGGYEMSIHWNAYLKKYLAVYTPPLSHEVHIRTADRPEGPWSEKRIIYQDHALDRALAHPEFSRDGGRTEYVSYRRGYGFFEVETRLLEVTFR